MPTVREKFPLAGKRILITRAASQSSKFRSLLRARGAEVLEMPALEIQPPSSWRDLDQAIANLDQFDWLIFSSANGVEYFVRRLSYLGRESSVLATVKIAVVGEKTAQYLEKYGLTPNFIPPHFVADSLVETFPESLDQKKILFPRVETGGRELIVQALRKKGASVAEVAAYQSECPTQIDPLAWQALHSGTIDTIAFASSKTVQNFYHLVNLALQERLDLNWDCLLEKVHIASIGPETSKTCNQVFGRVDLEAQEYTLEGLTEAIINFYLECPKHKITPAGA